jgi:hypothetical protein
MPDFLIPSKLKSQLSPESGDLYANLIAPQGFGPVESLIS